MNTQPESLDARILKWGAITTFVLVIATFAAGLLAPAPVIASLVTGG
jgi:hypothetical protein